MNDYNVKRMILAMAIQSEIEGMKAENQDRESRNECVAYVSTDFCSKAEELRNLAAAHDHQL